MEKKKIPNSLAPKSRKPKQTTPNPKPITPAVETPPVVAEEPVAPVVKEKKATPPKAKVAATPVDVPKDERKRFNFLMDKQIYKKMKLHCMEEEITGAQYLENLIMKDLGL